jgi:hypothetical protein
VSTTLEDRVSKLEEKFKSLEERVSKLEREKTELKEEVTAKRIPLKSKDKIPYKKGSISYFGYKLINDKFFDNDQIRTTKEMIDEIRIKYGKHINPKKAAQSFLRLVKYGYLNRDEIKIKGARGDIWFLPMISKKKVEMFKKKIKEENKNQK